ncbi:phosphate/phosphite/phosphonate ABC transporter substrate-binding protein [Metabacillus halosaccharovorans]|uniref:phosphate/phosphite/phosphonate ABC transporter substrate-binding protein n=1 Tax=Metabacillus halosaccharovorans TaxID=930124 RepID=UPI001C1F9459|nr:phosphate/phosphite/phosphonate ABC transporter substrate-binding protein [Metabacillus halosaccharovorans]MBU7595287.1 phosphate/phosphite/phosphonate ABC transporter substrate-binding protein [Metabacillus halosaccharovorans]
MMKKLSKLFLTVGLVSTLAACGNGASSSSSAAAETENKGWPEELTLVQMPNENNPNAASMHTSLREHLSEELGIEVKEFEGGSYAVGIEALASGNLDIMLASPMSYYQADKKAGAELLVTPQVEGLKYYTAFITQKDNEEINNMEDLKGKNFAFVNAASSSGYLYPKGTLVQEFDLDPDLVEQSGYFFENVTFSESHPNSAMGVKMGDYDAAAVAQGQLDSMIEAGTIKEDEFKTIGRTDDIPDASYIVREDLPEDFKEALRDAFVSFDDEKYFEAVHNDPNARFVATEQDYYDPTIEMLDAINALEEETK